MDYLTCEQYSRTVQFKAVPNDIIKVNVTTPDTYQKIIILMQQDKIVHHTYQLKEERAYRIVLINLYHSIPTDEVIQELAQLGDPVRNILSVRHYKIKELLPLFFIDFLELKDNNKCINDINMKLKVEPPNKKK